MLGLLRQLEWIGKGDGWVGFGDTHKFVVFGDALGATHGTGFDLASAETDDEVRDGGVFGFAGTVRDDGSETISFGEIDRFDGFCERADLVDFNEDRVAGSFVDGFLE